MCFLQLHSQELDLVYINLYIFTTLFYSRIRFIHLLFPKHTPPPSINYLSYLLHPSLHVNTLFGPFSSLFFFFPFYIL